MEELKRQVRKIVLSHLDEYRSELGISYDRDENSEDLMIECEEEGYVYWSKQEWEPLSPFVRVSEFNGEYWVTVSTDIVFLECFGIQINGNKVWLDDSRKEPQYEFWDSKKKVLFSFNIEEEEFREYEVKRDRKAKLETINEKYNKKLKHQS
jgi:hypothetical protein